MLVKWYKKAAEQGVAGALYNLGVCYLEGDGVSKNIEIAYQLAMKVRNITHDGEDGDIYYIEGKHYESNIKFDTYGHPNGVHQALECYDRAIRFGNEKASQAKAKLKAKYRMR